MSRRVRQYLDTLTYETDEDTLHTLSLQWEPAASTGEPHNRKGWKYFIKNYYRQYYLFFCSADSEESLKYLGVKYYTCHLKQVISFVYSPQARFYCVPFVVVVVSKAEKLPVRDDLDNVGLQNNQNKLVFAG